MTLQVMHAIDKCELYANFWVEILFFVETPTTTLDIWLMTASEVGNLGRKPQNSLILVK